MSRFIYYRSTEKWRYSKCLSISRLHLPFFIVNAVFLQGDSRLLELFNTRASTSDRYYTRLQPINIGLGILLPCPIIFSSTPKTNRNPTIVFSSIKRIESLAVVTITLHLLPSVEVAFIKSSIQPVLLLLPPPRLTRTKSQAALIAISHQPPTFISTLLHDMPV